MKPQPFTQSNTTLVPNKPGYLPLAAYVDKDRDGLVMTCWTGTWRERLRFLLTGQLWIRQHTFGQLFQPHRPQIQSPFGEIAIE